MRGRPNSGTKREQRNNNLDAALDASQEYKEEPTEYDDEETREAGEGSEMLFHGDDEL